MKKKKSIFESVEELIRKPESSLVNFTPISPIRNHLVQNDPNQSHSQNDIKSLMNELKKMNQEEINDLHRNNLSFLKIYPVLQDLIQMSYLNQENN